MPKVSSAPLPIYKKILSVKGISTRNNARWLTPDQFWWDDIAGSFRVRDELGNTVEEQEYTIFAPLDHVVTALNNGSMGKISAEELAEYNFPELELIYFFGSSLGNWKELAKFPKLRRLFFFNWDGQSVTGDLADLNSQNFPSLTEIQLNTNNVATGQWSDLDLPNLERFVIGGNWSLVPLGDFQDLAQVSKDIFLQNTSAIGGKLADLNPDLEYFYAFGNQNITPDWTGLENLTRIKRLTLTRCYLTQADVDSLLSLLYSYRANFINSSPSLLISGNAAPSGTEGDPVTAGTGHGYITGLRNEGWSITI